jgi:polyhydroxybutyrate depolymerase
VKKSLACAVALLALSLGCSKSPTAATAAGTADASSGGDDEAETGTAPDAGGSETSTLDAAALVAARPYTLHVPTGYDASQATPLVVMFHGYGASGALEEAYMALSNASDAHTFLYAYPDGTVDSMGMRFWNATDACCDLYGLAVDDVQYFDAIVADVASKYDVDRKRVFVVGHSNGGFMGHRLACDRSSTVAAIFSLAGAQWNDPTKCAPSGTVSVAEVHGSADETIDYDGGSTSEGTYPAAPTTVADWGQKNGCTGPLAANGQTYDIDSQLPGNETAVQAYSGCPAGIDVQLWTIQGGMHIPTLTPAWAELVWGFLSAHPKP